MPPFSDAEGFADLVLGSDKTGGWRTFARWDRSEPARRLMVMLKEEERDALARRHRRPGRGARACGCCPMIALVLGFAIRRGLRPLYELSDDVRAVDVEQQHPLGTRHPQVEFRDDRRFDQRADAAQPLGAWRANAQLADELAHELRTPLASIALHASALQRPLDDDDRRQSLDRLAHDAIRSGHVLSQVLALARASQTEMTEAAQPVDLAALCRRVVSEFAPQALSSGHVLGYSGPSECTRRGHPVLLELALRNLVENAVSHTPAGTSIEVQLDDDGRWLQVRDDGRGQLAAGDGTRKPAAASVARSGSGSPRRRKNRGDPRRRLAEDRFGERRFHDLPGSRSDPRLPFPAPMTDDVPESADLIHDSRNPRRPCGSVARAALVEPAHPYSPRRGAESRCAYPEA